ncbi:MAG: 2-amino-4-hydroxy-6-hydroxymethyldihydropteridine diphosphokinase [Chloroflexi bacterium]|nr:MAG: 2-amino-4-hydroxy-6-hydroxymethyldihydropteridine diphosphokinase [Chloroflexota bacterium]
MNTIFLGMGTNLGDRQQNLQRAVDGLAAGMTITAVSQLYETPPWGVDEQPAFFNMCLAANTMQTPDQLLPFIKNLEKKIGRTPTYHWGPRLIDIDILFYNNDIIIEPDLTVPHLHMANRAFVLAPLADIALDFLHPQTGKSVEQMLDAVDKMGIRPLPNTTSRIPSKA